MDVCHYRWALIHANPQLDYMTLIKHVQRLLAKVAVTVKTFKSL